MIAIARRNIFSTRQTSSIWKALHWATLPPLEHHYVYKPLWRKLETHERRVPPPYRGSAPLQSGGQNRKWPTSGQSGYLTPAVSGIRTASQWGAKSEVAHKWANWLPHPCRIGDPHRFRAGGKIRSGPQVGKMATSPLMPVGSVVAVVGAAPVGCGDGLAAERLCRAAALETASWKQIMHAAMVLGEMVANACCKPVPRLAIGSSSTTPQTHLLDILRFYELYVKTGQGVRKNHCHVFLGGLDPG